MGLLFVSFAFSTLNIALSAPIPNATVSTATAVNPGVRRKDRNA